MMRRIESVSDATLAFLIAALGLIGVGVGFATVAHPFDIAPSLDGTLTAAQLGFVLAVLHGLRFKRVLWMMTPVVGVLVIAALRQHESPFALAGVTLALYGVIGIAVSQLMGSGPAKTAS
jgi:hypothetical protein